MTRTGRCFLCAGRFISYFRTNIAVSKIASRALNVSCSRRPLLISTERPIYLHVAKSYKHDDCDSDSESDEPYGDDLSDILSSSEVKDPLISELTSCASVQEVFDILKKNEAKIEGRHASQAVSVLSRDLQKMYVKVNFTEERKNPVDDLFIDSVAIEDNYVSQIKSHQDFDFLLELVKQTAATMSPDETASAFLNLYKIGVSMKHPVLQTLAAHCEELIDRMKDDFPLTALSRFTVTVHDHGGLWSIFVLQKVLPLIISKIETCDTAEDLRLVTICLAQSRQLLSLPSVEAFRLKVETMIKNGSLTAEDSRAIIKAAVFLNTMAWSEHNLKTTRMLLSSLKGHISSLQPRDLAALHTIFHKALEPAELLDEIQQYAAKILSQYGELITEVPPSANLLVCVMSYHPPTQKKVLEKLAKDFIAKANFAKSTATLFKILTDLKTSDIKLCETFWCKSLEKLEMFPSNRDCFRLLRHCSRYLYFNNNLGGTYRHYEFEKKVICWLLEEIKNGMCSIIPQLFARAASFLIAYGSIGQGKNGEATLKFVVDKLLEMAPQLSENDCLIVSRGFQVAMLLPHKKHTSEAMMGQFVKLDGLLNECTRRHLNKDHTFTTINLLMFSYIIRIGAQDSDIFQELIRRYESVDSGLSSRPLRAATLNFIISGCLIPATVDRLVNHVIDCNVHLLGGTVERVLYLCYNLGYRPPNADVFLPVVSDVILRDRNRFTGLSILSAALALTYFQHLPEELAHFIFNVGFLERLDEEISLCYSKESYPVRVRRSLMHLNRAVCLDYPELDIPWFHEKYCQEVAARDHAQVSSFNYGVKKTLIDVLGGKELLKADIRSPYGYKIDFQVLLDKDGNPVQSRHAADKDVSKLAVLLYKENAFSNNVCMLKGPHQLKQRHLEILGYRVVSISSTVWNSMYMAEPDVKHHHIQKLIWP